MQIHPGACGEVVANTNLDFVFFFVLYQCTIFLAFFIICWPFLLWGYSQNHSHHHTELTPEPYGSMPMCQECKDTQAACGTQKRDSWDPTKGQ